MTDNNNGSAFSVLQVQCPKCGEENGISALSCVACGATLRQEESDPESLSFLHSEGLDNAPNAVSGSHKLKRLRLALEGFRSGDLEMEHYREVVGRVYVETRAMQDILKMRALREAEKDIPVEAVDVLRETADNIDAFAQGCQRMLNFGGDLQIAEEGLRMAESAVEEMEATQKEAAELQAEYQAAAEE